MSELTLPEGWILAPFTSCVEILDSQRKPVNNKERQERIKDRKKEELYPYFGATGQAGWIDDYLFDEELIALGEDGVPFLELNKDKAYMLRGKTWVNNHAHVLKAINGVSINKYLLYYLNNFDYIGYVNGGTRLKLTQTNMKRIPIYLPSISEQKEIVRLLDSHLATVEQIQGRLDAIPKLLEKFRQSVLNEAVNGDLTEEWRTTNNLNFDWQQKELGDVSRVNTGKTPLRKNSKYWEDGTIPWLTSSVTGKNYCYEAKEFVTQVAVEDNNLKLFPKGALLIAMYGEGKTRGQVTELMLEATCNQACAVIEVNEKLALTSFIKLKLKENYIETRKAASGGNQPNLNLSKVRAIKIDLPTIKEQKEIVQRVKELFTYADQIDESVTAAKARVDNLTQSILHQAFTGQLTEQWRRQNPELITGDNSAEALLAKIEAEKKASGKKGKAKK